MLIFAIQLVAMTAFFGRMGVVIYYLMYNVQRFDLIAAFMSLPSLCTVIGIFFTKNYAVKFGKKKMATIGYIGSGASLILIYATGAVMGYTNIPVLLVLHCLYGFFCFSFPIPMAMIPDAINYQEDKTGVRSDGTSYATVSLSTKFGSAFGVSGALLIMGATGYVANAQQTPAPRFRDYDTVMDEVDTAVHSIIDGNSNISMEQIIWNRNINKTLNNRED